MGFSKLWFLHFWTRTGKRRDFAAGWIKMPIDYFVGIVGFVSQPIWIAVLAYIFTFSCYVILGWYLMEKTHVMNYDSEWSLQFNTPMRRIHDRINGNRKG